MHSKSDRTESPAGAPSDRGRNWSAALARAWANRPRHIPSALGKTDDWLTMNEAAACLGMTREVASIRRTREGLVAVRLVAARVKGVDRWCSHRGELPLLASHSGRR